MPTHQSLGGGSDDDLLRRMIDTYPERFGAPFWAFYGTHVAPHVPPRPAIIDLGCGPGLFLRDLGERHPGGELCGYDVTPAMVAYGQELRRAGATLTMELRDVATQPLPHAAGTVNLVSISSVLHVFDEPLPVLAEIWRVLAPDGILLLHDWIRQPLQAYLAWRRETLKEEGAENARRAFRLFPVHNKYTPEDWQWLLATAGFAIRHQARLRTSHEIFVAGR